MKTPLAWKNLTHNRVRTAIGVAGVGFAVILIFMQMGFQAAIERTATQIYDALDFDLMMRSPAYRHLTEPDSFPRTRLYDAQAFPQVEKARPFYLGLTEWQVPEIEGDLLEQASDKQKDRFGDWRGIITMGTNPSDPAFLKPEIREKVSLLTSAGAVIVDDKSKADYGPINGKRFSDHDKNKTDIGVTTSLGPSNRIEIVGLFSLGTGMASNGACITSPEGYVRACPWQTIDDVNFGLIKLREGEDAQAVQKQMQDHYGLPFDINELPSAESASFDIQILTREQVNIKERDRWVNETPLGEIFGMGVWVAMFVGVAIVYQVLSTDIANMMGEYATLKAMGYSNAYLTRVVLQQSVLLAIVGYIPSLFISWGLYWLVEWLSGMPMLTSAFDSELRVLMDWKIAVTVLFLAIAICVVSGMAALRKLYQADPADLF